VEVIIISLAFVVLIKGINKFEGKIYKFLFLLIFTFILKSLNPLIFVVLQIDDDE